jgi:hypothetical protein
MRNAPRRFAPASILPVLLAACAAALLAPLASGCSTRAESAASSREEAATETVAVDPHVRDALERSCYDCHSDRGAPAWYAKLSFSYWFSGRARNALDFSVWPRYDGPKRAEELQAIAKTVREGEMPPWDYTLLLSSAKLSPDDKQAVVDWASGEGAAPETR